MLSGQVEVQAALTEALTAILGSTPSWGLNYNPQFNFLNGVGANQADTIYSGQRTIASSGSPDSVKLTVTLKDPLGQTATFVKVKAILVDTQNIPTPNTTNLIMGGAASNGFQGPFGALTHTITIKPGEFIALVSPGLAGWPVTATTADILQFANSGATPVVYNVTILGTSA